MVLIGNNTKSHNQGKESESEPQTNVATTLLRKGKKKGDDREQMCYSTKVQ